eukprot:gene15822-17417_t
MASSLGNIIMIAMLLLINMHCTLTMPFGSDEAKAVAVVAATRKTGIKHARPIQNYTVRRHRIYAHDSIVNYPRTAKRICAEWRNGACVRWLDVGFWFGGKR